MAESKSITLDLKLPNNIVIRANQYDNNSTVVQVRLTNQGKKYIVSPGNDVYVKIKTPSGKMILNKCFINSNGTVNIILTKNITATVGRSHAQLIIAEQGHTPTDRDQEVTYTSSFVINVVESVYSGDDFKQSTDSDVFFECVQQAKDAANKAEQAAAVTGAGMKVATSETIGAVKPDNKTTFVDENGTLSVRTNEEANVQTDTELNVQSSNPIANKTVALKFESTATEITALSEKIDGIKIPNIPEPPKPIYDSELNNTSENAIQNKTVASKFEEIEQQIQDIKTESPKITIDTEIADSSNPVENRVIKAAIEELASKIKQSEPSSGDVELVDSKPDTYFDFASIGLYDMDLMKIYVASGGTTPPSDFPKSNTYNCAIRQPQNHPLVFWLKTDNIAFSDLKVESNNGDFVPQMQDSMNGYVYVSVALGFNNPFLTTTATIRFSSISNPSVFAEVLIDYSVKQPAQGVDFHLSNAVQPVGTKIKVEPTWRPDGVEAPEYTIKKVYNENATTLSFENGSYYINVIDAGRDVYTITSDENERVTCTFAVLGEVETSAFERANPSLIKNAKKASDGSFLISSLVVSDDMLDENGNYEIPKTVAIGTEKHPLTIDTDEFILTLDTLKDVNTLSFAKDLVTRLQGLKVKSSTHVVKTFKLKNVTTDANFYITHVYNSSKSEWYEASNHKTITVDYEGADLSNLNTLSCAHWNTYTYADSAPNSYKRINAPILNSKVNGTYQEKEWKDYKDYDATCIIRNLTITNPSVTINKIIPCFPHVKFENCSINVTSGKEIALENRIVRTIEGLGEALNHETVTTFCRAFSLCSNLESVDIFNENPYTSLEDTSQMFNSVGNLRSITVDVTGVKKMDNMFSYAYVSDCVKLTGKPDANCSNVLDFASGATIKTIDVSELDLTAQDTISVFNNWGYVETLDLSKTKFKDGVTFTNIVPFSSGQYYTFKNFVLPSNISKATISSTRETDTVFTDASNNMYYEQPKFNIDGLVLTNTFVSTNDYKKKGGNK